MRKPLCIDGFCGVGGWSAGFLAEGWDCIGFDIERHIYGTEKYPGQLIIQDMLTVSGDQFKDADCLVMSPPCQFFSYTAMPWSRAKKLAAEVRADPALLERELALFNVCFRIQREACKAAGRHIPLIVENVRGAVPWVGPARWNFGSYYLFGDVPALMPITVKKVKVSGINFNGYGEDGFKSVGFNVVAAQRFRQEEHLKGLEIDGRKCGGGWFGEGNDTSFIRRHSSKSPARKAASAMIAKIPLVLSTHIARVYKPEHRGLFS